MAKKRDDRDALFEGLGSVSAEGLMFLAIGLVVGAIGTALALMWTSLWDRAGDA